MTRRVRTRAISPPRRLLPCRHRRCRSRLRRDADRVDCTKLCRRAWLQPNSTATATEWRRNLTSDTHRPADLARQLRPDPGLLAPEGSAIRARQANLRDSLTYVLKMPVPGCSLPAWPDLLVPKPPTPSSINWGTTSWVISSTDPNRGISLLVINLDRRKQMFGYVYSAGDWEAASPDGIEPLATAHKLQQAMRPPDAPPWKKCVVTIDRGTATIDIVFDYEGTEWVPDVADPERLAASLKPLPRS